MLFSLSLTEYPSSSSPHLNFWFLYFLAKRSSVHLFLEDKIHLIFRNFVTQFKGTVHASNIWTESLENGSLMTVFFVLVLAKYALGTCNLQISFLYWHNLRVNCHEYYDDWPENCDYWLQNYASIKSNFADF